MGYYTSFNGEIGIDPPVPWSALRDSKWWIAPGPIGQLAGRGIYENCIGIHVEETVVPTDEGATVKRTGTKIVVCDESHKHYDMTINLQAIVDELGPSYTFTGRLDASGEEVGDMWRLKVIGGKAVEFRPELVWPEESE